MSIDTIGNFLTIIRNGIMASKPFVVAPHSKVIMAIARVLHREGFINDVQELVNERNLKFVKIALRYVDGESAIHQITRQSKPSCRRYEKIKNLKPTAGKFGITILSTSRHGITSDKEAKDASSVKGIAGGEVICTVW